MSTDSNSEAATIYGAGGAAARITPCLWFAGAAKEAAEFYVTLLPNSAIRHVQPMIPDPADPAAGEPGVLIVSFTIGGQPFLALNGNPEHEFTHAVSFSIDCADQAEVDAVWDKLADGGSPVACGWIRDRYGLSWQVVPRALPRLLADPDPARAARVMAAMQQMVKLDVAVLEAA
ncbi:VOC family protein [Methylobrevis albus]|uniref:VOC family protein n=1 Tax=Methylobrevis albus TaxID=2793297 RepID=A0A931MY26_9HYPH|nr:VOC family protein [Methylobrevis albus]MBH0239918.1 VOC family protein [Methylobrevis albus]